MSSQLKVDVVQSSLSNSFNVFVGKRIRDLREKRDIAPQRFAQLLRVDEDSLEEYEAGSRKMPATLIVRASQQLCVSLSIIFSDETPVLSQPSHMAQLG